MIAPIALPWTCGTMVNLCHAINMIKNGGNSPTQFLHIFRARYTAIYLVPTADTA